MASKSPPKSKKTPPKSDGEDELDLSFMGSSEESAESRTVASRERLRHQLDDEVERFLAKGGHVEKVDSHVTASPPTRPVSRYGDRPI